MRKRKRERERERERENKWIIFGAENNMVSEMDNIRPRKNEPTLGYEMYNISEQIY